MKTHLIYEGLDQGVSVCNILEDVPEEYKDEEVSFSSTSSSPLISIMGCLGDIQPF